ncbi:MAG TPA: DICT sensory domain-containing protein [Gaiellaceae bacterium]|jgi:DNA-binding transcriptional MerR regulator
MSQELLTIGQMARRTGVSVPTLRAWEDRYGFPRPVRLGSGHRRFTETDCDVVGAVVRLRGGGLSLEAAIARATADAERPPTSLFASLRARRPELAPWLVRKRALVGISRAIEDECLARGERGVLLGGFQEERHYRDSEPRWRELSRVAAAALALADFELVAEPEAGPVEIPLQPASPLHREWALVWDGPGFGACLVAWERLGHGGPDGARPFEALWSVEPEVVRTAALVLLGAAAAAAPEAAAGARALLSEPRSSDAATARAATALTNRIVSYVA